LTSQGRKRTVLLRIMRSAKKVESLSQLEANRLKQLVDFAFALDERTKKE
jgi:hypothetical protein